MILDSVMAFLVLVVAFTSSDHDTIFSTAHQVRIALWVIAVCVSWIWARTKPDVTAAVLVASHILQLAVYPSPSPQNLLVPLILYQVSLKTGPPRRTLWLAMCVVSPIAAGVSWGFSPSAQLADTSFRGHLIYFCVITIVCMACCLAAWFAGSAARGRHQTMDALRQRAIDLERERDQSIRLATQEERAKIARDMHDIVAHSLSVIVVQADGGSYLAHHDETGDVETRLAASGQALDTIATTARHALDETRRLVGVLRDNDSGPELAPTRGLDDIPGLIKEMTGTLDTTLTIEGSPDCHEPLSQGAELVCYRVVQEALTNVLKHGGPAATAQVTISHHCDDVTVEIVDDGRGAGVAGIERADGAGHGLVGMRERVSAWGGTLEVGSLPDHGFRVHAVIPVH
ncbi:sensor histidine kinase [Cutibacterium sp. WCA-380-WT-3A]|uniref:histidine kinase n=1 Tax=Cutibacterium porci TaxID=2605781 RepID=A0A7K0J8J8_9ACTN|nr:sensor histidine kinase [Cutibacterium porci]MSS46260.1 sensor histidine kinase [Cutibacterium porci]